jgi:hypothetical protein
MATTVPLLVVHVAAAKALCEARLDTAQAAAPRETANVRLCISSLLGWG